MIKYYAICRTFYVQNTYNNYIKCFCLDPIFQFDENCQFDTREECINFMLNPENSHLFNENEEYTVMEIFKKLPKNIENGNKSYTK